MHAKAADKHGQADHRDGEEGREGGGGDAEGAQENVENVVDEVDTEGGAGDIPYETGGVGTWGKAAAERKNADSGKRDEGSHAL